MRNDHGKSEAEIKLEIGDWLSGLGLRIFDERPNPGRPSWGLFTVGEVDRNKRPDLIVQGNLAAKGILKREAYVAVEIKRGYKHQDILDGFDAVLEYFSDYLFGAEYQVGGYTIDLAAFVLATYFSREGFLFAEEGKFEPHGIVRGPWDAYPMTFTISRLLWRQRDNLVKRFRTLLGIPKIDRRCHSPLKMERSIPHIGVLVQDPAKAGRILLMLSEHPYHWHLEGSERQVFEDDPVEP
ncbi:MAG: hypothetical protein GX493_03925 [Firmicutes bacterium]|nr:hypothetical protein [Bacillota bacterium]